MTTSSASQARTRGLWLAAPWLGLLSIAFLIPEILAIGMSFTNASPGYGLRFIGLENYISILRDPEFWASTVRTVVFVVVVVAFQVVAGLGIALLIARNFTHKSLLIAIVLSPMAISEAVLGPMWKYIFSEQNGFINYWLSGLGIDGVPWLSSPNTALVVVIVVRLWIAIPPMFVLLYPAVLSVPHEYYEAARIDGATAWRQFISITLPVIATSIRVATVFGVIWTLGVFGEIFVLTQGGPQGGTETIGLFLYRIAFGNFDWGEAAAVGTLAVLFTLAIAIPQIRLLGRDAAPAEVGP